MNYFNLHKYAKSFRVQKIRNIFAISFNDAKENDLLDRNNRFRLEDQTISVRKDMMICKDYDNNIWTETKKASIKDIKKHRKQQIRFGVYISLQKTQLTWPKRKMIILTKCMKYKTNLKPGLLQKMSLQKTIKNCHKFINLFYCRGSLAFLYNFDVYAN
jgi:hypothetical protein